MTKEAVARQYFRDFLENLGDHEHSCEEYCEEESNQIITETFFSGELIVRWDPSRHTLMLKFTTDHRNDDKSCQ